MKNLLAVSMFVFYLSASVLAEEIDHVQMDMSAMQGMYGSYAMSREASGTSWQPDSTSHEGIHRMGGEWTTMIHGFANLVVDHQGGPRGDNKTFSSSMLMLMGQRPLGEGTLGLRGMVSLDPLMGKSGYPLLLQTGESADGRTHLIDRQHPHDLLMELAVSYSLPLSDNSSVFAYAGLPGEPALGPPAFMHRFSGIDNPEAPITHHWLDSTHITFGVMTLGYVLADWKLEASAFRGREPDQSRYNIETGRFDSSALRLTYNPAPNWSAQVSYGRIASPEQLEPEVNVRRTTASLSYNKPIAAGNWQTTWAWGRNAPNIGETTQANLLESAVSLDATNTFFGRAEWVDKNELFEFPDPLADQRFRVVKASVGYIHYFPTASHYKFGLGGLVSKYSLPAALSSAYGGNPTSYLLFARIKIK